MYKIKGTNDIITFQNEQCSCFGAAKSSQEQFLAKQKTFQLALPQGSNTKNYDADQSFQKSNFKKSLKRQFVPMSPTSKASQPSTFDNHLEQKSPNPLEKSRQMREFLSPQTKTISPTFKTYVVPSEPMRPHFSIKSPQPEIVSCKTLQQQPPQNFMYMPQPTIAYFHSPSKTIKINYNSSPITYTSPPKRSFSPISTSTCIPKDTYSPPTIPTNPEGTLNSTAMKSTQVKQERDDSEKVKIISKPQMNIQSIVQKDETSKSYVKIATMKSGIGIGMPQEEIIFVQTGKSIVRSLKGKHEGKKHGQAGRSKIDIKSLKEFKHALKKMDDVEEIYSQPDSEELCDSDKQSVVLGRLNEYGSMIEPSLSHTSEQFQAKIMRFNSLSVNIQEEINRINNPNTFLTY